MLGTVFRKRWGVWVGNPASGSDMELPKWLENPRLGGAIWFGSSSVYVPCPC